MTCALRDGAGGVLACCDQSAAPAEPLSWWLTSIRQPASFVLDCFDHVYKQR